MTLTYARPNDPKSQTPTATGIGAEPAATEQSDKLRRIGRRTFKVASITFVIIGLLHTFVQLTDMAAPGIQGELEAIGAVENVDATAWELWQGLGLLMGFFMIALGLSNLAGLQGRIDDYPAAGVCVVNIVMFVAIGTIGYLFLGPMQLFGAPFGIAMMTIPLLANRKR